VPSEAIYFFAHLDGSGAPLSGGNRYSMTFDSGSLPPLADMGFWSVTMYGTNGLLVENALHRYIIRPDSGLAYGADGSLTIYLQAEEPSGVPLSNWLPSPSTEFAIGFRAYRPAAAIKDGSWFPPAIEQASQ
jgi:hypothetical protein